MKRLVLLLTTLLCLSAPVTAFAYNPLGSTCGATDKANNSAACSANGSDPVSGPHGALKKASLIIATLAGIAAVIIIIVSGFFYVISGGDAQKVATARSAIIGSVIGLIIIVSAEGILTFVISKL